MDKSFILGSVSIIVALFAIYANADNVWNSPSFEIKINNISNTEEGKKPVDEIVRTIYNDRGSQNLTAEWIRNLDEKTLNFVEKEFSSEDAWILDRVYFNPDMDGLSQKIIITNTGNSQAHDVIVQILGYNNFKIIDYSCPEIMSEEQIQKELGKKYIISKSRMSEKLQCEITINSIGHDGIKQIIVTADETHPSIWPDDLINGLRSTSIILEIFLYVVVGVLAIVMIYNMLKIYEKKTNAKKKSAV